MEQRPQQNSSSSEGRNETPEDFKELVNGILHELPLLQKSLESEQFLTYGQTIEKTTSGREILIDAIEMSYENLKKIAILAADAKTHKITGLRIVDLSGSSFMYARGNINVRERGQGIATILDKTLVKILQNIANKNQHNIVWEVTNGNLTRLRELEEKGLDQAKINDARLQQERWQKLWGAGGEFGHTLISEHDKSSYRRKFTPNNSKILKPMPLDKKRFDEIIEALKQVVKE